MGQSESKDDALYGDIIKHTLKGMGHKCRATQIHEFLQFVQKVSPWFPEPWLLKYGND